VFEGAQTKTLSIPTATTMDIIPAMVCVFPVPGYKTEFFTHLLTGPWINAMLSSVMFATI
jgi:hypothetical protein